MIKLSLAIVALAASFAAQPVLAGLPAAPSAQIKLDPATLAGDDSEIHARIVDAARRVCRAEGMSMQDRVAARECHQRAVRSAEAQLLALRQTARGPQQALATIEAPKAR